MSGIRRPAGRSSSVPPAVAPSITCSETRDKGTPSGSLHVIEGATAGGTLLDPARANHVDLIVLGAPAASQRALAWWRSVASSVTANADCSVHVVRVPER